MSLKVIVTLSALPLLLTGLLAHGESNEKCQIAPSPPPESSELEALQRPLADGAALISADQMSREGEVMTLQGDARLIDSQQRLSAEQMIYDQKEDIVTLKERVTYQSDRVHLQSDSGIFHPDADTGTFINNSFYLPGRNSNGSAAQFTIIDGQHSKLVGVRYTTCPPDDRAWEMSASSMELDQQSNTGEAYNVTLKFKSVPFLYLPYINFPLEGRKSGLLPPTFSSSERNGTDITLPWYWNIAPEYDATITPRSIQNRGTMLMNEFRFLTPNSRGEITIDYLPSDQLLNDNSRKFGQIRHNYQQGHWYSMIDLNSVSDDNYLNDLGSNSVDSSSVRLEQRIEHGYRDANLHFKLNLQSYQELTNSPIYQRLPQLTLAWNPAYTSQWKLAFNTEWSRFAHPTASATTGSRFDIRPTVSYPVESASGFIRPRLTLRHTSYQLDNTIDQPAHTVPIVSIDSGLFFDRYFQLGDSPYQQTLEPRLYYLNVPYVDQSSYPTFDTSPIAFSWNQLFQENRFSGADRQIDANQLSVTLSSRFIEEKSGMERLRLSAGKIISRADPTVDLGTPWSGSNYQNLITEVNFRPFKRWQLTHSQQFRPGGDAALSSSAIKYRDQKQGWTSISYRRDESTNLLQSDVIANLRLGSSWHLIGRRLQDINNKQRLDSILGFEYESCCWTGRLIARDEWKSDTLQLERSYLFNIEFTGLGKIGRDIESLLGNGIMAP